MYTRVDGYHSRAEESLSMKLAHLGETFLTLSLDGTDLQELSHHEPSAGAIANQRPATYSFSRK